MPSDHAEPASDGAGLISRGKLTSLRASSALCVLSAVQTLSKD